MAAPHILANGVPSNKPTHPATGLLLREAIEDLEWTGGEVEFVLRRSPMRFALRSLKQQSLEVRHCCSWVVRQRPDGSMLRAPRANATHAAVPAPAQPPLDPLTRPPRHRR